MKCSVYNFDVRFRNCLLGLFALGFFALLSGQIQAQDSRFTQFWIAPMSINPAWTGNVPHWKATGLYRHQWFGVNNGLQSFFGSFEYNFGTGRGSLGTWVQNDRISSLDFNSLEAAAIYSYQVNLSSTWKMSMALQGSFGQRTQGLNNLRFEDAMLSGQPTREPFGGTTNIQYPDLAAGVVAYSNKFWVGAGVYHLLQPERESFFVDERTRPRITAQMGYKWEAFPEHYISPSFLFQYQDQFMQIDTGINWEWQWLYAGVWYRGFPTQTGSDIVPAAALSLVNGIKINNWQLGVGYEFAVGSVAGVGGTYEISLSYAPKYDLRRSGRAREEVVCPINFR